METFKEKFRIEELLIARVGSWDISLRPVQVTIGSLVLSLNRICPELHLLESEEAQELATAFKKIETLLTACFQPDRLNYLALMMVDRQVHFHVVPRYAKPVVFKGNSYEDIDWPKPPDILTGVRIEERTATDLLEYLKIKAAEPM